MSIELFTNSYITLEEANTLLEAQSSTWSDASDEQREKALVQATTMLDDQVWLGQVVDVDQPLSWPRLDFSYYDHSFNRVIQVTQGTIPRRLKLAVSRQALHLLSYPSLFEESTVQDFERLKLGPLEVEDRDDNQKRSISRIPYSSVKKLLEPLLDNRFASRTWWRAN
jgi:hypothetical protein